MTPTDLKQLYPNTHTFFDGAPTTHPLWKAIEPLQPGESSSRRTFLPTLERMCESIALMEVDNTFRSRMLSVTTMPEFMHMLSQLYVAYLYRDHAPRLLHADHGYHVELSIADQLLALGIVNIHSLDALDMQFQHEISDVMSFMKKLHDHSRHFKAHPSAHHHVAVVVTQAPSLSQHINFTDYMKTHRSELALQFPDTSGVLLVHALPEKEEATFFPFHTDKHDLEWMLTKES